MNKIKLENIRNLAKEFGVIAGLVNESSIQRRDHSKIAIDNLESAIKTSNELLLKIEKIFKEEMQLRDRHALILNTFTIMQSNLLKQIEIIKELSEKKLLDNEIRLRIIEADEKMLSNLERGISLLGKVVKNSNDLILLNNLILKRKKEQSKQISELSQSTIRILVDAEKAIAGSSSNLERSAKVTAKINEIDIKYDKNELTNIMHEVQAGYDLAVVVNKSSRNQFEFAETVNKSTRQLHAVSLYIDELITQKHELFNKNLEPIAEIAVLVAVEMMDYLELKERSFDFFADDHLRDQAEYQLKSDLNSYLQLVFEDCELVANENYDMTYVINMNAQLTEKSMQLTKKEIDFFSQVKESVALMTEATKYPIEGSGKNIENSKKLENLLSELYLQEID